MSEAPRAVGIGGVTFRLHEDRQRLYSFGWTCGFCGRNSRTTTEKSRDAAIRRHVEKGTHKPFWPGLGPLDIMVAK